MIRIIDIDCCKTCKKVVLQIRLESHRRQPVLEISAWHEDKDGTKYFQYETMSFETDILHSRYMQDFSELSANEFANAFEFPEPKNKTD